MLVNILFKMSSVKFCFCEFDIWPFNHRYGGYGDLKIVVINTYLSILIICKNSPRIINAKSSFIYNVRPFLWTVILNSNIVITKKLLIRI